MATTPVITTLVRNRNRVVIMVDITYNGSDLTNSVLYDSSAQNALILDGHGVATPDPLKCTLRSVKFSNNSAAALIKLNFDASTPVLACVIPPHFAEELCFDREGGLVNYAGTGITGDITMTTSGLTTGETISLVLDVAPF